MAIYSQQIYLGPASQAPVNILTIPAGSVVVVRGIYARGSSGPTARIFLGVVGVAQTILCASHNSQVFDTLMFQWDGYAVFLGGQTLEISTDQGTAQVLVSGYQFPGTHP